MFKTLYIFIHLSLSALAQHHHGDRPSVHGMFMMGKEKVYLSHLPMFHSPHDYQVIVEVELDAASKAVYRKALLEHPNEPIFTLEPEVFSLPDMIKKSKSFKGKIYLGHFERGGILISSKTKITISSVVYFKKFDPKARHPQMLTYLLFGNEKEMFLAHKIETRPDFDHIVEMGKRTDLFLRIKQSPFLEVTDIAPESGKELYLEHGDLE